jgi:hypothetical protein
MTTVIFVHGTGVRVGDDFAKTFKQIKDRFAAKNLGIKVVSCPWGGKGEFGFGARLNACGASIPGCEPSLSFDQPEEADENTIRWRILDLDPLYELKLLAIKAMDNIASGFTENPGEDLDLLVEKLTVSSELKAELDRAGISAKLFYESKQRVIQSKAYQKAIDNPSEQQLNDYPGVVARSIIAIAIESCTQHNQDALILEDPELRNQIVEMLRYELTEADLSGGNWTSRLINTGLWLATPHIQKHRLNLTCQLAPMLGDILLYQTNGQMIRQYVLSLIEEAESQVVLLAHSLGGIACVDLLAEKCSESQVELLKEKVKLLITVGSQAPFLYELGTLHSLKYSEPLPKHFPAWLNIYDPQDFLSYVGSDVFPKPHKVTDIKVDNGKRFLQSHLTYWDNEQTWNSIFSQLP